ncbi:unnamed protein product, partial [Rotaria socialis]
MPADISRYIVPTAIWIGIALGQSVWNGQHAEA